MKMKTQKQSLWDTAKAVAKRKFCSHEQLHEKKDKSQPNGAPQAKPKISRWKEIKIRAGLMK
jgi:hypothetical protein